MKYLIRGAQTTSSGERNTLLIATGYFALSCLAVLFFLSSCQIFNSPKTTVKKFFDAVQNSDLTAMAEVATPGTVQIFTFAGPILRKTIGPIGRITATETITGDSAVVSVTFENKETIDINLVKIEGKWKVSIPVTLRESFLNWLFNL